MWKRIYHNPNVYSANNNAQFSSTPGVAYALKNEIAEAELITSIIHRATLLYHTRSQRQGNFILKKSATR